MRTNLELRYAALTAADLLHELDRLGIHVERVALGQHGTDINFQVGSAFDCCATCPTSGQVTAASRPPHSTRARRSSRPSGLPLRRSR